MYPGGQAVFRRNYSAKNVCYVLVETRHTSQCDCFCSVLKFPLSYRGISSTNMLILHQGPVGMFFGSSTSCCYTHHQGFITIDKGIQGYRYGRSCGHGRSCEHGSMCQVDKALDSRSKGLGFDSHCWSCVEVSGKVLIPHCLCQSSTV